MYTNLNPWKLLEKTCKPATGDDARIIFEEYYRCSIGRKHVRIMPYEPRNPHHLRYVAKFQPTPEKLAEMEKLVLRINEYLGYDFNTVELALRNGVPYAIDFCNPALMPKSKVLVQEDFKWVVETIADSAIERHRNRKPGMDNLSWGEYITRSANGKKLF